MSKLRVPSLQHLARNWSENPDVVSKRLVKLAADPPRFNYNPVFRAIHDLLVLGVSLKDIEAGLARVPREAVRNNYLSILPLLAGHFEGVRPDFVQMVERRHYPVGRGLKVPFDPPLLYGVGGQLHFPWFSFWKQNPLGDERLSLFVTLVDEMLLDDPDLEAAKFEILDFSAPGPRQPRDLSVLDAAEIPRVTDTRKFEMLNHFAEGFLNASEALSANTTQEESKTANDAYIDDAQLTFLD